MFTFFHFGVSYYASIYQKGHKMVLFEYEKEALRYAKFTLLNRDMNHDLIVWSLGHDAWSMRELYRTRRSHPTKLKKVVK